MDDVAGNKLADRYFPFLSVADDRGGDTDHCFQFRRRRVRASFLNKAQAQSKNNHQEHDAACAKIARGIGNGGEHRKQNHQRIAAGGKHPVNPGARLLFGDLVWTVLIEPSLGFFTQTGFRCAKPLKKLFDTDCRQFVDLLETPAPWMTCLLCIQSTTTRDSEDTIPRNPQAMAEVHRILKLSISSN